MQTPARPIQLQFEESIPLRPEETIKLQTRKGWEVFLAQVPLPCLWVSAHVDPAISRTQYGALEKLKQDLWQCKTTDTIANAYREFLQKLLIKLNWIVLRSKTADNCFHFRGTVERDRADVVGRDLHYHFAIWAPNNLFITDPRSFDLASSTLQTLWHRLVNDQETINYKPIHIDVIRTKKDAEHIAGYENKANSLRTSYELFDDWSTSQMTPPHDKQSVLSDAK
jgi:hypothetical protein